ncbi:HTH-type transcriptional regulator CynR [Pigmentiphaga humi]|uniref:HTH-type transcriptional regulator CynR n=1 Tax=Pigmentiphaga humi TaxID=2478468 RepID=A0A3P4B897_9BURK|nr:LysR family transcriptional regulator [Pigmentiphaga humi]VCU71746.1 HTH-type transcriptional regulator CynR [Pigmentiphaga humi]
MAFTLVQLQHFSAVVRYGSFSAAARALGVAQPAISQSVAALEEDLGVRLFDRNSRKCTPTAAGLVFVNEAAQIISSVSESREKLRQFQTGKSGKVVVGLTPGISNLVGEHLLRHMHETAPGLDVIIVEAFMTRLQEFLLEERIDCAVSYGLDTDSPATRTWQLGYEPFCLVGKPALFEQLAGGETVGIEEIARLPLFLATLSYEEGVGRLLIDTARKRGVELDVRHQVQSLSLIRRLLLHKGLATVTPIGAIIDELCDGRLESRPLADGAFVYPVQFAIAAHRNFGIIEKGVMNGIAAVTKVLLHDSGIWRRQPGSGARPDVRRYLDHAMRAPQGG